MSRLVFLLLFLISSCSAVTHNLFGMGSFADGDAFYKRFPDNRKALVVLGYDFAYRQTRPIYWCKVDDMDQDVSDIEGCKQIRMSKGYKMVVFAPGLYKMVVYDDNKDDYIFGAKESRISKEKSLHFELVAGQVAYVGKLVKKGARYEVKDEFVKITRALKSKNYQELVEAFHEPMDKIEWFVQLNRTMVKTLALKGKDIKKSRDKKKNGYCQNVCDRAEVKDIRARQRQIELDRHKYNRGYLNQILKTLDFDKKRCGIK